MPEAVEAFPRCAELRLPADWRQAAFISDLHLSEDLPRTTAAFERLLETVQADALFILGDLFEYWVGDDMLALPFEARCAQALRAATRRLPIHVLRGNRDFLLGERFFAETGCRDLADPTVLRAAWGDSLLVTHGDALCIADTAYQQFRAQVRQPAWQAALLARPLEERVALARQMRAASRDGGRAAESYADADAPLCSQWLAAAGTPLMIHGHTHRPGRDTLPGGAVREVLCDWELDQAQPRADMLVWSAEGLRRESLIPV
ncbi:UDP-2,3-diacylglucosamine diphosphatase [Ideonella dechloratans]|uniref:UDP-2,3-diacylglucosamine diphosphatase n=1 Tax=Ideonella dechloratans TaxID=36863 RepID=UPI0035B472C4